VDFVAQLRGKTVRLGMTQLLYRELSNITIGAAIEVHRNLGPGFLEAIYEQALSRELTLRAVPFQRQTPLEVAYKGEPIGEYRTDFVIDSTIIIEIKACTSLNNAHVAQARHYLAATGYRLAILLNFGTPVLQIKRIIR
jgi:GxxExxY protein